MIKLTPCPSSPWSTALNHRVQVPTEAGPRENRTSLLAHLAKPNAALAFITHQGPATNNATIPALSSGDNLEMLKCFQRSFRISIASKSIASANASTGSPIRMNEVLDNNPSPTASPRPIQLRERSDVSVQVAKR